MKGDIAETESGHDSERPVETGDPTVLPAFKKHEQMKNDAEKCDDKNKQDEKLEQEKKIPLGRSVLDKIDEK
jgi:hypothetical protein